MTLPPCPWISHLRHLIYQKLANLQCPERWRHGIITCGMVFRCFWIADQLLITCRSALTIKSRSWRTSRRWMDLHHKCSSYSGQI